MKQIEKPDHNFRLIKAIRGYKQGDKHGEKRLHKMNVQRRDASVRKFVQENVEQGKRNQIFPGQLIMFNYFNPMTGDKLDYYDAMPCTIFFGIVNTEDGKRVLGFNLHYYPPRIRYQLMDRIFEIFKSIYIDNWDDKLHSKISEFNYHMLIKQLQKAKLDFGVRMYIPQLMANIRPIPPMYWQKAVFTEGHFKKETRAQILNYWKNKAIGIEKPKEKQPE
jgi:hypothetical protein